MTGRAQLLAAAAADHAAWVEEHADEVEAVPGDSAPHDGQASDYAEHHADRSAPADVDDLLSVRLVARLAGEDPGDPPAVETGTAEAGPPVDDAGDVILEAGWVPVVPAVPVDLVEARTDRRLRAYWVRDPAGLIGWGTAGDLDRAVAQLRGHVTDPEALCGEYRRAAGT